ncbi:MAG: 16S rRNA (uracil(1498)-N(3))-methyltransferase [Thiolinea sp.]
MRIPRFYLPDDLQPDQNLELPPGLFRHAVQVLRLQPGQPLILFNGRGGEYHGTLQQVDKRRATLHIDQHDPIDRESALPLTLVQSMIKPDKMDLVIQKSVELGVSCIQPLSSQRSVIRPGRERLEKKMEHWQAVIHSACEQSGRTRIPTLLPALELQDWLSQDTTDTRLLLMPGAYPRLSSLSAPPPLQGFSLLVGPEGGFTEQEEQLCLQQGVTACSLGPRILRAETAGLAVLAWLQLQFGDL